jgi:hypothetical protein
MLGWLKNLFGLRSEKNAARSPEAAFVVRLSGNEIINQRPDGQVERIALANLKAVIIETNDSGPWGTDVWWILVGNEKTGCVFPGGASGEKEILEAVQKLPGFDNEVFIEAMGSTANQRFLCWTADT